MSGSHRPDGMFVLSASDLPRGRRAAAIADMAPTILRLCAIDPPAGLDGKALVGSPRSSCSTQGSDIQAAASEHPYDAAEEHEINARLTALGYLE
jgi:hypothetical protein